MFTGEIETQPYTNVGSGVGTFRPFQVQTVGRCRDVGKTTVKAIYEFSRARTPNLTTSLHQTHVLNLKTSKSPYTNPTPPYISLHRGVFQ